VEVVAANALAPHGEPCASCGCPVEADDKFCPACGTPRPIAAEAVAEPPLAAQKHFRCSNCGSQMSADPDQRSYVCPFCDSTYVVEFSPDLTDRQRPEFVIGFAVTREEAQEKFRQWLRDNSWFRPGDLATQAVADKQRGVYLPFWSFSMFAQSRWSATIGEYWYRTVTYTTTDSKGRRVTRTRQERETEWWPLSGKHHRYYSGFLISGSTALPQVQSAWILPFNLPALKRYEPYYLAGWLCEEYTVEREAALQTCI
jgi:DNA-directed RNA polymerase subunit RPC12/RpoP